MSSSCGVSAEALESVSTPDRIESRLGVLEFDDGAPSEATAVLLYDHLDFVNGVQAFLGAIPGASLVALRRGFRSVGAEENSFLMFSEADGFGVAVPDRQLRHRVLLGVRRPVGWADRARRAATWGAVRDPRHDRRHVVPVGHRHRPSRPGIRSAGGRYLLVGPGYHGPLPESGFHVSHVRTTRVTVIGRAFMVDNDPKVPVDVIRNGFRVSPYVPGAQGTAVASFLAGRGPLGVAKEVPETRFIEASGLEFNTLFPGDYSFWETIDELVQQGHRVPGDPGLLGLSLAAVGIVHGKPFKPNERMRKILEEAAVVGNATARTVTFAARPEEGFAFYPDSQWCSALFIGGYQFLDPPPHITADGPVRAPSDGARKLDSRTNFFYMATGTTPAMCMRLTGIGSQYIYAMCDSEGNFFDGGRSYRLTLPADIPQSRFWSVILYDRQTCSMLQTDQHLPRLGSQSGTVETNPDGSTDIYFGPTAPDGEGEQLAPDRPRQGLVDDPAALQPTPTVLRQVLATQRDRTDLRGTGRRSRPRRRFT